MNELLNRFKKTAIWMFLKKIIVGVAKIVQEAIQDWIAHMDKTTPTDEGNPDFVVEDGSIDLTVEEVAADGAKTVQKAKANGRGIRYRGLKAHKE